MENLVSLEAVHTHTHTHTQVIFRKVMKGGKTFISHRLKKAHSYTI